MDAQSESCEPPPCDPQPPGKIRKAFKLFGKRKPGTSVASIFSMRGKGDGEPKSPPSRSKTMDGFNEPTAPEAEAEQVDLDQEEESQQEDAPMEEFTSGNANLETTPTRQSISSITSAKSLSFLNMIRKGRRGIAGERQAQTESQRPGRQRKGLKGLFGSVRWRGKEKEGEDEEVPPGPPLLASRSNSVEIIKESLTLTPGPTPRSMEGPEEKQQLTSPQEGPTSSEDSVKVSEATKPPTNERLSTLLGDISSILSLDSLGGCGDIVADVEAEWVKASSRVQEATGNDLDKTSAAILARSKLSPSPISTLSPTTSTKPSPTSATKPTPSPTSTKPIPSSLTKPVLSPTSTPVTKASPSVPSAPFTPTPTSSPLAKPTPATSAMPITQPTITPIPTPITQATPTSKSVSISESALGPTSSPTAKPTTGLSPKSSPEIRPATISLSSPTSASITKPIPSSTPTPLSVVTPISETSPPDSVSSTPEPPAVTRTEPPPTPTPTPVTKPTHAPTPVTKPTPGMTHETKHATSATKYSPYPPPFGKPTPAPAPTPRPKLVTTFGLSTSRNTAPITKIETKQPTGQTTKSSVSTFQTDKTGTTSTVRKASVSEPTAPVAKPPSAVSSPPYVSTVTKPQPAASPMAVSASKPVFEPSYDISNTVTPASSNSLQSSSFCTPTSAPILTSSAATTKTPMVTSTPHSPVLRSPSCPPQSSTSSKRTEDGDFSMDVRDNLARQEGIDTRDSLATQSGLAKSVKKSPAVKPTTLSKIPVSGGGRTAKQHHRDAQPNGDDDHSNLPTPVHEEESPVSLSRESSSKDPLSDFSTESGAVTPTLSHSQEDILDGKLGLQTGPRPATGAASLSRESKIPIKHGSTATYHSVQGRAEAARSKIPVSKVPVRRTSNKPATTSTAAVTRK